MKILPGIIENDFDNFTKGISVVQTICLKFFAETNLMLVKYYQDF